MSTLVLETQQFEAWAHHLSQAIGHHESTLLTPEIPFSSRMEIACAGDVSVVAIAGSSSVRLSRSQPHDSVVLWLPRCGWVADHVNGSLLVAEPGSALLCLPGDDLLGDTSLHLSGFSLLLPATLLADAAAWRPCQRRLLQQGPEDLALIHLARDLVSLVVGGVADPAFAVAALADQLLYWRDLVLSSECELRHPVERRALISRAREWMQAHLAQPFRVTELASALHLAPRTLQLAFREELGRSPMEEVRRLRFRALRRCLLVRPPADRTLAENFGRCGLAFSPLSQRRYREWCGETPQQTRARGSDHGAG